MATLNTKVRVVPKEFRNKRIYTGSVIYSSTATAQGADVEPEGYTADEVTLELDVKEFSIKDGGVDTTQLAADAVDGTKIADDSIDSEHYVDGSIDNAHLAADCVNGTKIADDSIDSEHYADLSIDTVHLAADCVDGTKIEDDAIDSEHYAAASIDYDHLSADCFNKHMYDNSLTISSSGNYDQLDVENINFLIISTAAGDISLRGLDNGYNGQVIRCIKSSDGNALSIYHAHASGHEKIHTADENTNTVASGFRTYFTLIFHGGIWLVDHIITQS